MLTMKRKGRQMIYEFKCLKCGVRVNTDTAQQEHRGCGGALILDKKMGLTVSEPEEEVGAAPIRRVR